MIAEEYKFNIIMDTKAAWVVSSLILLHCLCGNVEGQSYSNYSSLVSTVLTGYNSDIIPLDDHSQTLTVTVAGYLYSLVEVDVLIGKVTVVFALTSQWVDSQINWTPSSYGNLASISIPKQKVWTPSFVLGTPLDFTEIGESWMPVTFLSNGTAIVNDADVVDSACTFNMKFWPFDTHTCDISFTAFGYTINALRLQTESGASFSAIANAITDHSEWLITDMSSFTMDDPPVSRIVFRIELERRSGIFIILIIFPLYALAFLNSIAFLLPSESGERIGFVTTLMLSITVFLETISDYLPNTSKPVPLLCIIISFGITMSIACTLLVIVSLHLYHKSEDEPIHTYFVTFIKFFNKKYRHPKVADGTGVVSERDGYKAPLKSDMKLTESRTSLQGCNEHVETFAANEIKITWKNISATFDKVAFVSMMVMHTTMTIVFTCYLCLGSN